MSYIIPYGRSQECDIYGPICQTGSITVGVNLTYTTTTSVLPCSSYLTAQSQYLQPSGLVDDDYYENAFLDGKPDYWGISFGQSPECKSYVRAYGRGYYTFPECGISSTVFQTDQVSVYPSQIPPGLIRRFSPTYSKGFCCGNCSLNLPEVRLYYFPDSSITDCHYNTSFNYNSSLFSPGSIAKRIQSLVGDGSTAVVDGHTL